MKRPRLTRGQWRLLLTLAMREHAYGMRQAPAYLTAGMPSSTLLRYRYAQQVGRGYRITDRGLRRVRRAGGWIQNQRALWSRPDDPAQNISQGAAP